MTHDQATLLVAHATTNPPGALINTQQTVPERTSRPQSSSEVASFKPAEACPRKYLILNPLGVSTYPNKGAQIPLRCPLLYYSYITFINIGNVVATTTVEQPYTYVVQYGH
jgi:hypothetical protein